MHEHAPSIDYHAELKKARKADRRYEKAQRSWDRLPLRIAALALSVTTIGYDYNTDVATNKQRATEAFTEITTLSQDGSYPDDIGVFYMGGFDTISGEAAAEGIGPAISQVVPGEILAIRDTSATQDSEILAEKIIDYATTNKLESVIPSGYSMDGNTAAEIGDYIIHHSDIPVAAIFMNESPSGYDGLKPPAQTGLSALLSAMSWIKDAEYSTYAKYLITIVQDAPVLVHGDTPWEILTRFIDVSNNTWHDIQIGHRSPMWQVNRQAWDLLNSNLQETIAHIGEAGPGKMRPVIVVTRTANPEDDSIVDVEKSSTDICSYAEAANLDCFIVMVDGVHHSGYNFDTEAYMKALADQDDIIEKIELEQNRYLLANDTLPRPFILWRR